jgi:mRNA-degrading endonuclease RelE of RelBE toxin-antitoxin system
MRYEILLAPEAAQQFKALRAFDRAAIREALETHLRHRPDHLSKSRIKRLRGLSRPQYRLRVNDFRVFYDIIDQEVQVLAIIAKKEAEAWLEESGEA